VLTFAFDSNSCFLLSAWPSRHGWFGQAWFSELGGSRVLRFMTEDDTRLTQMKFASRKQLNHRRRLKTFSPAMPAHLSKSR